MRVNVDTRADLDGYRNVGNRNLLLGDNMDQQYRKRAAESRWSWWYLLFLI